ncbi:MAG: hypothetical protein MJY82_03080 [Fibrobacter sp.]|nr:hypothetical protein [Fibrobacter sp.]
MNFKKIALASISVLFLATTGCYNKETSSTSAGESSERKSSSAQEDDYDVVTKCDFSESDNDLKFQYVEKNWLYAQRLSFGKDSVTMEKWEAMEGMSKSACEAFEASELIQVRYVCTDSVSFEVSSISFPKHGDIYGGIEVTEENYEDLKDKGYKIGDYFSGKTRKEYFKDFMEECQKHLK